MTEKKYILTATILTIIVATFIVGFLTGFYYSMHLSERGYSVMYFFFQDEDLTNASGLEAWKCGFRNFQNGCYSYILDGLAHLCYYGKNGSAWGTSSLSQCELPHDWGKHSQLLGGYSVETSNPVDGVEFTRDRLPHENEYLLSSKVLIVKRAFLGNVGEGCPKLNVGITLYCSYKSKLSNGTLIETDYFNPSYDVSSAVYIDIFFSSSYWNSNASRFEPIEYRHHAFGDPWTKDHVIALTVDDQVESEGEWREINVDMSWVFNYVFCHLPNIESITVRGAQIYSESIGCLIDSKIDYVKMEINK